MGNVCGCVRAEKEEQFLDPAKTPLRPEKCSAGRRKYFRRDPTKESGTDPQSGGAKHEQEKRSAPRLPGAGVAPWPRALLREGHACPSLALEEGVRQGCGGSSLALEEGVQQGCGGSSFTLEEGVQHRKVSSQSHLGGPSPAQGCETEVQVNELEEGISEDSTPRCAKGMEPLDDANAGEITFQRNRDGSAFQTAASLPRMHGGPERSLEKCEFLEDPAKNDSSVQEKQDTERFCPHATEHFQLEEKSCRSLCTNVFLSSKDADGKEVSAAWSPSLTCK